MPNESAEAALERLMADDDLVRLCELQRTGDEVLKVVSLNETQHSDILGWLLDPREGHGQGDQILRDLLIAASTKVASGSSGLNKGMTTHRFFADWPASRIRTTSFGSAFYARELGMKKEERVDLFVIDPQNKFILLIENKFRANHSEKQLAKYRVSFIEAASANAHLRGYSHVYIALDRDFDVDDLAPRPCEDAWLHLGYDWLQTSGKRALVHVERGNAAAKLVVEYCNRQTDWESPEAKLCIGLASELHQRHPEATKELVDLSTGRLEKDWLNTRTPSSSLLFLLQNKRVLKLLRETKGMASVKMELHRRISSIPIDSIEHARAWLDICPSGWEQFEGDWWPLVMSVRFSNPEQSKFNLRLVWNSEWVKGGFDAQALRAQLTKLVPKFGSFGGSQYRRVVMGKSLSLAELAAEVGVLNKTLALPQTKQ